MNRRKFILLTSCSAAALGTSFFIYSYKKNLSQSTLSQPTSLSQICDEQTIRDIGTAYRACVTKESNTQALEMALLTDTIGKKITSTSNREIIASFLEQKIKQDFESGKTIVVKGWVLSETEARQCALFSINNS